MKCLCRNKCQIRIPGARRPRWYKVGDVENFTKCPPHFISLEEAVLDFSTASIDMLNEMDYDLEDLKAFIVDTYGVKPGKRGKDKCIDLLLDCRLRHVEETEAAEKAAAEKLAADKAAAEKAEAEAEEEEEAEVIKEIS